MKPNKKIEEWLEEKEIETQPGAPNRELKKVINGHAYSRKTAARLASWNNDGEVEPYLTQYEWLYQTRRGQFFLIGNGQGDTPFGWKLPDCDDRIVGHALIPLTVTEAREWLEMRDQHDALEQIFGDPDLSDTQIVISLTLSGLPARQVLDVLAEGESLRAFAQAAVSAEVKRRSGEGDK